MSKVIINFDDDGDLKAVINTLKARHPNDRAYIHGDNIVLPGGALVSSMKKAIIEQYITIEQSV